MPLIAENTFAAACYDQNTLADLEAKLSGEPDAIDMHDWNLTADEWRAQIALAIAASREDIANDDLGPDPLGDWHGRNY